MEAPNVLIRDAKIDDFKWMAVLIHNAIDTYYGEDCSAHAERILDAHINSGHDRIGFFSFEQHLFILEVNGVRAGMVHIVGKRQSTYKISLLIVAPAFRGSHGIGSMLLKHIESYAQSHQARQLYCAITEKNIAAMQFFLRKGFIQAGSSDSYYKDGLMETLLYKPLYKTSSAKSLNQLCVSILPFNEATVDLKMEVRQLLLEKLSDSFDGITDEWVTALFVGCEQQDINTKHKLLFVATDGSGQVIGIAGATPKKDSPIKIIPFIATNIVAFEALLIDIPHQLMAYSHKLYVHINPTADEVISLQRLGWKLDAALPNAYGFGIVTQQWSLNIGKPIARTMHIKQRDFDLIQSGEQTLLVRVGYDSINRIQVGERLELVTPTSRQNVRISAIRRYDSFKAMLEKEPFQRIAPNIASQEELLSLLKRIYPPDKEWLGVVVFELTK